MGTVEARCLAEWQNVAQYTTPAHPPHHQTQVHGGRAGEEGHPGDHARWRPGRACGRNALCGPHPTDRGGLHSWLDGITSRGGASIPQCMQGYNLWKREEALGMRLLAVPEPPA